jgi:hypothetical protein
MAMNRLLCIAALLISVASLSYSAWTNWRVEDRVQEALDRRERKRVEEWRPKMLAICQEFDADPADQEVVRNAQTVEELAKPFVTLIEKLSSNQ